MNIKRFFYFLMAATMLMALGACSDNNDDMPDDDTIWDISPAEVVIQLVDESGNNLLDPAVSGNWVGEPMWIEMGDKVFDVIWEKENLGRPTKALLTYFYGAVWTGVWSNNRYSISFGEFNGETSRNLKLKFGITAINSVYEFEYSHRLVWENKEPHFDDHITYDGKRIDGNTLTVTVPQNDK